MFSKHQTPNNTRPAMPKYGLTEHRQWLYEFPNGYGASIVQGTGAYSNGTDTYELAVLRDGHLCYTTPITSDVLGHLSEQEVRDTLQAIHDLSPATRNA